ncbi:ABC transporter substrate-binding protein [Kineococcus sp. SYSU DK003]|uniref:ABC transporter substrate-binding protein n=1 Tax=Kineococcus sp. SYSU DK003 TaxID=3383124 RepID=UPI003D7E9A4F
MSQLNPAPRNLTRRSTLALATTALLATGVAGCSGGDSSGAAATAANGDLVIDGELVAAADLYAAAQDQGRLVFYTGASEQSEKQVADAFTEATGIEVEIVRLAPNKLSERILSEVAADKLGADVIRISGEDLVAAMATAGAFDPVALTDDITAAVDTAAVYEDGLYYSSFDRVYSFGYNNQVVDEASAPKNWADLVDGSVSAPTGTVQVGAGGSTAALTHFQLQVLGEDWLRDYAATGPRIFDSSASLTDALARGEIGIGTIPIATAYSAILEGAPLTVATPEEGAAAYPFYLAQGHAAANPEAATVFVNWLMSGAGQKLAASIGDYPVHAGMPEPTIGDITLPAAGSGFVHRATLEESLASLEPDAQTWTTIFGYTG